MNKTITIVNQDAKDIASIFKGPVHTDMIFKEIQRDTIGRSGSNPTWGHIYLKENDRLRYNGIALHKEYDYDYPYAAYAEKAWSIIGNELIGDCVRVPIIDVVEERKGYEEIISYRLMNNDKEDMIHIKDTLFNKYERDEIREKRDIYTIDELLECIKLQINNEENYKKVEKSLIFTSLLDPVTNNGDRHPFNWALVRDKKTGEYTLAVFDHSSAFINMFEDKEYFLRNGWNSTYVTVGDDKGKNKIGSSGQKVVESICKEYPEYFKEFLERFDEKLPRILELIKKEQMKVDLRRFEKKMDEKRSFLKKLIDRGEIEYE